MTLIELLKTLEPNQVISIGSLSGYMYIGEAHRIAEIRGEIYRQQDFNDFSEPLERKVISTYARFTKNGGIAVIVYGVEHGQFWNLEEYEQSIKAKKRRFYENETRIKYKL